MRRTPTPFPEVWVVHTPLFTDPRGTFTEVFHAGKFAALGLPDGFAQDNHSRSVRHALRGLHYQLRAPQGKLVRVTRGAVFDVVVDVRRSSVSLGRWWGTVMEEGDGRQLWIPPGFAHGFLVLSDAAEVAYKCTTLYDEASSRSIAWNDPAIGIEWPLPAGVAPILSATDAQAPALAAAELLP